MMKVTSETFSLQKKIAILAVFLFSIKVVAYLITHSTAILADVMETSVNVAAAFIGLVAIYISLQPADASHPFGHGKVELVSAMVEGAMITIAGVIMIVESLDAILHPHDITDLGIGIVLIVVAGVANFIVGKMAIRKGEKSMSPALVASGKHLVSDTYVAIGVVGGLCAVLAVSELGYDAYWLDAGIALVFSLVIVVTGVRVVKESIDDIMDKSDVDLLQQITDTLNEHRDEHWIDIYGMRLMKHGCRIYADFRVVLPKDMTVDDVAREERELQEAITSRMGDVEISMTPVPCDDGICWECGRECTGSHEGFLGLREWTVESVTSETSTFLEWGRDPKPIVPERTLPVETRGMGQSAPIARRNHHKKSDFWRNGSLRSPLRAPGMADRRVPIIKMRMRDRTVPISYTRPRRGLPMTNRITNENRRDSSAKMIFSYRSVVAMMFRGTVPGFEDTDMEVAESYFGPETVLKGIGEVDPKTGLRYDLIFEARIPGRGKPIRIWINIEPQNDSRMMDRLTCRMEYYSANLLSMQKGRTFVGDNYFDAADTYSIWVLMDPPKRMRNRIRRIRFSEEAVHGDADPPLPLRGIQNIVVIGVGDPEDQGAPVMLRMLDWMMCEGYSGDERREGLEELGLTVTKDMEDNILRMNSIDEDRDRRMRDEGREEGRQMLVSALANTVRNLMKNNGWSMEEALSQIDIPNEVREDVIAALDGTSPI